MKLRDTYLFRLYHTSKWLFVAVLLLIVATIHTVYRTREQFPVLLYGMYSLKAYPQREYTIYKIMAGGRNVRYASLPDSQRELIYTTLEHVVAQRTQGKITDKAWYDFLAWLYRYVTDARLIDEPTIVIKALRCKYEQGLPRVISEETLAQYEVAQH
ncbi:MAG: hypothetical protein NZM35_07445 [Chitinophagales bacterium]|nr:hypothetical protein [Chitinophagales bacterium]MDW8419930.1 hypothetical protein [Chitinophagales bacterium]